MTETGTVKSCIACGKNLNGQKRMKDSQGRYWCMECGTEDQRKKLAAAGPANICSGCGETFQAHQLSVWGSKRLCASCSPSSKGPGLMATVTGLLKGGGGGGGGGTDKKKIIIMGVVMVILALIAAYVNLS